MDLSLSARDAINRMTRAYLVQIWRTDQRTALDIAHDIEEAFYLTHRGGIRKLSSEQSTNDLRNDRPLSRGAMALPPADRATISPTKKSAC
jgi:ABC-type nitrate/sulfonate/bicarbonate transport system ATPase subunit